MRAGRNGRGGRELRRCVAWSKAAGCCGHEHGSIAAASRCACKFNRAVHYELAGVHDLLAWQRRVRRLVKGQPVDLDAEENLEEQHAAVDRATAPLWTALEQSDEAARRAPVFARPGSRVFHLESCRHVAGLVDERRRLDSIAAAHRAGMRPCAVCKPRALSEPLERDAEIPGGALGGEVV